MSLNNLNKKTSYRPVPPFKTFDRLLLESIDEAFSTLGESPKTAIYQHMERKFGISKKEIPHRLEEFSASLEKIFGLGAKHLEILFMKNIHKKIIDTQTSHSACWAASPLTFPAYVQLKKQEFKTKVES